MKYRHNITQDQPIVNPTDNTSDALRSSTHACAASLRCSRQTDCKQWGYDERPQKHQGAMVQHGGLDRFRCCDACQQHGKREDKHWLRMAVINTTENGQR